MWLRRGREEGADASGVAELAALADGSLPPERRAELEAQVAASPALADRLAEQERAVALLQGAGDEVDAPAGLRARVEAQRPARPARAPRRLAVAGLAAAAVAAAVVGVSVVAGSGSHGARFQVALGSTPLAPGASGEATLTKTSSGWRIHLDAAGLPRLANGRFYEAWLRNSGGALVPIGTFNEGRDVTLWAGVSPASFTVLTVTRERADGNQASSGEKVLAGPVRTR
ncbi:MAG TPA: anti-sigma factor [Gaiellaceae bacterium]|nr:anti-sigma factor [Gaiellaceae bacterium]